MNVSITNRFKDVLWSLKREFGLAADIDRIITPVAFERIRGMDQDQLEDLFISPPRRTPADFHAALLAEIMQCKEGTE